VRKKGMRGSAFLHWPELVLVGLSHVSDLRGNLFFFCVHTSRLRWSLWMNGAIEPALVSVCPSVFSFLYSSLEFLIASSHCRWHFISWMLYYHS